MLNIQSLSQLVSKLRPHSLPKIKTRHRLMSCFNFWWTRRLPDFLNRIRFVEVRSPFRGPLSLF